MLLGYLVTHKNHLLDILNISFRQFSDGFRWIQTVLDGFQVDSTSFRWFLDGFRWFWVVSGGF